MNSNCKVYIYILINDNDFLFTILLKYNYLQFSNKKMNFLLNIISKK